jgi:4-amino-4-deoxy-L-arabinose transferase-like glycosyltransferase
MSNGRGVILKARSGSGGGMQQGLAHLTRRAGRAPLAVVGLALVAYAVLLFVVLPEFAKVLGPRYGISFADNYDGLAHSLASGHGYRFAPDLAPTLMREPGYPLFLAGVFAVLGYSIEAARFANLLLAGAAGFLLVRLAAAAGLSTGASALAAAIFLLHPGTVIAAARGGFELFFVFLLLLFMLFLSRATERNALGPYAIAGLLLGLVAITRNTILLFPALLLGYFLLTARGGAERARYCLRFALLGAAMLVVLAPWVIRNYQVAGEFIPTTTVQGVAAQSGLHICKGLASGRGLQELDRQAAEERNTLARQLGYQFRSGYYQYFHATPNEIAFNRYLLAKVAGEYRSDPLLWMRCMGQNAFNFWFAGKTWQVTMMNAAIQLPFLALAALGVYWYARTGRWRRIALPMLLVLYLYALHVPIHAQARYSAPLVPLLAIAASLGIMRLLELMREAAVPHYRPKEDMP